MSTSTRVLRVLGSTLAGALGFAFGYYAGLFAGMTMWDLESGSVSHAVLTVGLGSLFAGAAIALTVRRSARLGALVTAVGLGAILVVAAIAIDAALELIVIGGLALVMVTSLVVRTRTTNTLFT